MLYSSIYLGYLLNAGQLEYDYRHAKCPDAVANGSGLRSMKPLWHIGVPPYVDTPKAHGLVGDKPSSVTPETIRKHILPRFVSRNRFR